MKLIRFLKKCKGEKVKIETKENKIIEGIIVSIDKTMNIDMSEGVGSNVNKHSIRGSSIRYILFREDINFKKLLVDDRPKNKHKSNDTVKRRKL